MTRLGDTTRGAAGDGLVPHRSAPVGPTRAPATVRIGTAERERASEALGEHFAAGRLDTGELETRLRGAYAARTRADLDILFADLPGPTAEGSRGVRRSRRGVVLRPAGLVLLALWVVMLVAVTARAGFPPPPLVALPFLWLWFASRRPFAPGPRRSAA